MGKRGYGSLIWGGLLIVLGLLLLVSNLDLLGDWDAPIWSLVLAAFGLVFLSIFVGDRKQWWALIPGLVILGISVAVFMAEQDLVADYVVATIILAGVGIPFLLIFVSDRQHWWALIPAMTMIGIALGVFLEGVDVITGPAVGGLVMGGISLGFLSIYLVNRDHWWALIPGGAMGIPAFFLLLAAATKFVWPLLLILLGLLLLRGTLGGGRRRTDRAPSPSLSMPAKEAEELNRFVNETKPERKRLPTLEEQIEAAVADAPEETAPSTKEDAAADAEDTEPSPDIPPAPEMPEPPDVPPGPEVG